LKNLFKFNVGAFNTPRNKMACSAPLPKFIKCSQNDENILWKFKIRSRKILTKKLFDSSRQVNRKMNKKYYIIVQ
jgi:hypothetical protein